MITHSPRKLRLVAFVCALMTMLPFAGCKQQVAATDSISRDAEEARVTSPAGDLDAVLVREDWGGAVGGWEWFVYIVAKGHPVDRGYSQVFQAGTLTGEKLEWAAANVLEIRYDIANIEQFRNLWRLDEIRNIASLRDDYCVEIRLAPARPLSIVTSDGHLRLKGDELHTEGRR